MDIAKSKAEINKQSKLENQAQQLAFDMSFKDLGDYARALKVQVDGVDEETLRFDMVALAKKDPLSFIKASNNPITKLKTMINKGVSKGVISYNKASQDWTWSDNDGVITRVPHGADEVEFLVDFFLEDENRPTFDLLTSRI